MAIFQRSHLFQTLISGLHVSFRGCRVSDFSLADAVIFTQLRALRDTFIHDDVLETPGDGRRIKYEWKYFKDTYLANLIKSL